MGCNLALKGLTYKYQLSTGTYCLYLQNRRGFHTLNVSEQYFFDALLNNQKWSCRKT